MNDALAEKLPIISFMSLEIMISVNEVLENNTQATIKLVPGLEGSECSLARGSYINTYPFIHLRILN